MTKQVRQAITPTHILGSTGTAESDTLGYRTLANFKNDLGLGSNLTNTTVAGTLAVTGGQIAFPSTAVPSANANTLDDYEEGTWTPTSITGSYTAASGTYTKIGRVVVLNFSVTFPASGMSGLARLASIPFQIAASGTSSTITNAGVVLRTIYSAAIPSAIRITDNEGVSVNETSLYTFTVEGTLIYFTS